MRRRGPHSTVAWVTLAVLGLVVAVGVSYAASQLSKPSVGLSSEPVPGVSELAPGPARGGGRPQPRPPKRSPGQPAQTAPAPVPTTTSAAPTPSEPDDSGGESGGDD